MSNITRSQIVSKIKNYINSDGWLEKAKKRNPAFAEKIENASEDSITFGYAPTFVMGYAKANATASGENTYGDTTTKRTISMDFDTDEYLFISHNNKAEKSVCKAAVETLYESGTQLYNIAEARDLAEKRGRTVCSRSLSDLNFYMNEYRLNRYHFVATSNNFTPEFWPMYITYKAEEKEINIPIGYCYSVGGKDYIDVNISIPLTNKQKWIIAGAVLAVAAIIALILLL